LWSCACLAAEADLKENIERVLADEGLTGIAWTLSGDVSGAKVDAAGSRDNLTGLAFSPDTQFHVGSLTKSLLATGVLRLATEERIDLDAPAHHHLPESVVARAGPGFSDVTVRHLLDHTSGLNDAHMWHMFSERSDPNAPLAAAFPDPQRQLLIRSRPGSRFSYSNMGYTLLGIIIESVVGERYEAYLDENVLAPLAMHESTFAFTSQEGEHAAPSLAWGHVDGGLRYAASPMFLRPAGQFTTTAADLARFAEFLMSDGMVGGHVFVDEALMRSRGRPSGTEAVNAGLIAGYAFGTARRDRHDVVGYCHGGNIVGFVARMCVFPDENKAFAYSVNMDSETADYGRFDSLFINALEIAEATQPLSATPEPDVSEWLGRYVLSPNRFQMFEYLDTVFGAIKLSADGDSLLMESMQAETRRLRPVGEHLYSANDRATTSHVLIRGQNGEYLISDGFLTFEKVSPAYLTAHWASVLLGLAGLGWILTAGSISLMRYRFDAFRRPVAPAFIASTTLFLPIPFFMTQSFMALGDFTVASALLATVTLLLPFGMLWTILLSSMEWRTSRLSLLHGIAAALVLQWCVVLIATGMLPFRLWA